MKLKHFSEKISKLAEKCPNASIVHFSSGKGRDGFEAIQGDIKKGFFNEDGEFNESAKEDVITDIVISQYLPYPSLNRALNRSVFLFYLNILSLQLSFNFYILYHYQTNK